MSRFVNVWDISYIYSLYIFLNQSIGINFLEFSFGVKFRDVEFFVIGIFRGEQRGGISKIRVRLYLRLP